MSEKPVVVLCYASKEIKDSLSENWAHSTETLQDSQQSARLGDVANRKRNIHLWGTMRWFDACIHCAIKPEWLAYSLL